MTVGQGRACKRAAHIHLTQNAARRVALAAMAGAFDEIAAAIPLVALGGVGAKARVVEIEELPQAQSAPDGKGKGERVCRRFALDRRQGAQERREIGDILRTHALIRGVWKGGVEMGAV